MTTTTRERPPEPAGARRRRRDETARPMPARREPGRVRLTRRGRIVLAAVCLLLATGLALAVALPVGAGPAGTDRGPAPAVVVAPGQTLWDIARAQGRAGDPRSYIDAVVRLNALASAGDLDTGQRLVLPRR